MLYLVLWCFLITVSRGDLITVLSPDVTLPPDWIMTSVTRHDDCSTIPDSVVEQVPLVSITLPCSDVWLFQADTSSSVEADSSQYPGVQSAVLYMKFYMHGTEVLTIGPLADETSTCSVTSEDTPDVAWYEITQPVSTSKVSFTMPSDSTTFVIIDTIQITLSDTSLSEEGTGCVVNLASTTSSPTSEITSTTISEPATPEYSTVDETAPMEEIEMPTDDVGIITTPDSSVTDLSFTATPSSTTSKEEQTTFSVSETPDDKMTTVSSVETAAYESTSTEAFLSTTGRLSDSVFASSPLPISTTTPTVSTLFTSSTQAAYVNGTTSMADASAVVMPITKSALLCLMTFLSMSYTRLLS